MDELLEKAVESTKPEREALEALLVRLHNIMVANTALAETDPIITSDELDPLILEIHDAIDNSKTGMPLSLTGSNLEYFKEKIDALAEKLKSLSDKSKAVTEVGSEQKLSKLFVELAVRLDALNGQLAQEMRKKLHDFFIRRVELTQSDYQKWLPLIEKMEKEQLLK